MMNEWIGARSAVVKNVVEWGAVKKFAAAIGDFHPLYFDEEMARNSRYRGLIAPPTFAQSFDFGEIEGLPLPKKGLIHGEQMYSFARPLAVGETVWCYMKIEDVYEKKGSKGNMLFVVRDRIGDDADGNRLFTSRAVTIVTEAVRKGMEPK